MIRLIDPVENKFVGVPYTIGSTTGGLAFKWTIDTSEFPYGLGAIVPDQFVLQIATDLAFNNVVRTIVTDGASQELTPFGVYLDAALSPTSVYFWRVGFNNQGTYSGWSTFACFVTMLTTPVIQSVEGEQTIAGNSAKVTWAPISDASAESIIVQYGSDPDNLNNSTTFNKSPNSGWLTGLTPGNTYYCAAKSQGYMDFDYAATLSAHSLDLIVVSDNSQVEDSLHNFVIK